MELVESIKLIDEKITMYQWREDDMIKIKNNIIKINNMIEEFDSLPFDTYKFSDIIELEYYKKKSILKCDKIIFPDMFEDLNVCSTYNNPKYFTKQIRISDIVGFDQYTLFPKKILTLSDTMELIHNELCEFVYSINRQVDPWKELDSKIIYVKRWSKQLSLEIEELKDEIAELDYELYEQLKFPVPIKISFQQ